MRFSQFLFVALYATAVAGTGLRTAYEKIMLFYAYQIDQLNPEADRIIGVRCAKVIHNEHGGCQDVDPKYISCTTEDKTYDPVAKTMITTTRACRSLREFMSNIDDRKWARQNIIPGGASHQADVFFDIDATAMNIHAQRMDKNRYPPWRVIKDGTAFNLMLHDVGKHVADTKSSMTAEEYETHEPLFHQYIEGLDSVAKARFVDHSYYLIQEIKEKIPGITIMSEDAGYKQVVNEGGTLVELDAVEFKRLETIDANKDAIPDIEDMLKAVEDHFYETDPNAKDHLIVMQSIEMAKNQVTGVSCSL